MLLLSKCWSTALGALLGLAAVAVDGGNGAVAQSAWAPGRTVRIIVPFPPGGTGDLAARLVGEHVSKATGQAYIVEHRPGGGTVIATEAVARSAPDGTTLLVMSNSFVINAHLKSTLSYDPLTSFEPVCSLMYSPLVLAVHRDSAHKSFAEFRAAAQVKPPALSIAAVGPATTHHMALEMLKRAAGIDFNYVPFTGGAPAANTLIGNHVSAALVNYHELQEHLGRSLRPLAIGSDVQQLAGLKDVPSFDRLGYGGIIATAWFGLVAPAKTPASVLVPMTAAVKAAIDDKETVAKMQAVGLVKVGTCGAEFAASLKGQHADYGRAIKDAGIKTE